MGEKLPISIDALGTKTNAELFQAPGPSIGNPDPAGDRYDCLRLGEKEIPTRPESEPPTGGDLL